MISWILLDRFKQIVGSERVKTADAELICYGYDAYFETAMASAVLIVLTKEEVQQIVVLCNQNNIPYVARGSGTGYAGGSIPKEGGIVISLTQMTKLEIDPETQTAWAQAGVVTKTLADAARIHGLRYPPDPSSISVCTIGGNAATNAGGPHCLGYGVTSSYVLSLEYVAPDGSLHIFGGQTTLIDRFDMRGLIVGAEGTLGIVTAVKVRLIRQPESIQTVLAKFETPEQAITALEMIFDRAISLIALDFTCGTFLPTDDSFDIDGDTIVYIDIEGFLEQTEITVSKTCNIVNDCGGKAEILNKSDLMSRRYSITIGRIRKVTDNTSAVKYFLFDAIVPRSKLREMLGYVADLAHHYQLCVGNTFHAGDGNIHPMPFYNPTSPESVSAIKLFWQDVLTKVYELDGVLSGEHGIGIEKRELISKYFDVQSIKIMKSIKQSLDPHNHCNPGKVLPQEYGEIRNIRSWEIQNSGRLSLHLRDGYIQAASDVTVSEIVNALKDTPYELGFNPVGMANDVTLDTIIALGRPGWDERISLPCRDQFLGGVFVTASGSLCTIGSPFSKDVSSYDLRKIAYGGNFLLGHAKHVWLKIRPKPEQRSACLCYIPLDETTQISHKLNSLNLPYTSLALTGLGDNKVQLIIIIEGPDRLLERAKKSIQSVVPSTYNCWDNSMSNALEILNMKTFWEFREERFITPYIYEQLNLSDSQRFIHFIGQNILMVQADSGVTNDSYYLLRENNSAVIKGLIQSIRYEHV